MVEYDEIIEFLGDALRGVAPSSGPTVTGVQSIVEATNVHLTFLAKASPSAGNYINNSKAGIILVPDGVNHHGETASVLVAVDNPRLRFAQIIEKYFVPEPVYEHHPTAVIHPSADVHPESFIGPYVVIDKHCKVGRHSLIHAGVHLYSDVHVGERVIINSGTSIGQDGFGYERDDTGLVYKFPHLGGVRIGDDVEIGANTCIDRGTLNNTVIRSGAKVDNLVHISHNCDLGSHSYMISQSHMGGSSKVGERCWVSPLAAIRNGTSIGDDTTLGMMSLVTKHLEGDITLAGIPAQPLSDFLSLQKKLKAL